MKKLRIYLKTLSPEDRERFSIDVGTTLGYLRKAISVGQELKAEVCAAIEKESDGKVTRKDLRPNNWHTTWPELADKNEASK